MADRFEDLIAWQKARVLTARIYEVTRDGRFARDFGLASQIQRAAVSVMANLAEGFDRNRMSEFARFLEFSRGSAAEVVSHLYVAKDAGYLDDPTWQDLMTKAREVGRLLTGLHTGALAKLSESTQLREEPSDYLANDAEVHWALGTGHFPVDQYSEAGH